MHGHMNIKKSRVIVAHITNLVTMGKLGEGRGLAPVSISNSLHSQQYVAQYTVMHVVTTTASVRVETKFVSAGFYCLYRHRQNQ
jgi:hypothetical protein